MPKRLTPKKNLEGVNTPIPGPSPQGVKGADASEAKLIAEALGEMTTQEAADWLNDKLPTIMQKTRQAIWDYARGTYAADIKFLYALRNHYPITDKRHQLAAAIIELRIHAMRGNAPVEFDATNGKKLMEVVKVKSEKRVKA